MVTPRAALSIGCWEIAAGAGAPSQYPEAMKCDYYARGGWRRQMGLLSIEKDNGTGELNMILGASRSPGLLRRFQNGKGGLAFGFRM